jgi:hypothetical protein
MAAELVAKPQGPFEIKLGAAPPRAGRGDPQRFGCRIDGEKRSIAGAAALDRGQADAGAGDRGADGDAVGIVAAGNLQPAQAFGLLLNLKKFA